MRQNGSDGLDTRQHRCSRMRGADRHAGGRQRAAAGGRCRALERGREDRVGISEPETAAAGAGGSVQRGGAAACRHRAGPALVRRHTTQSQWRRVVRHLPRSRAAVPGRPAGEPGRGHGLASRHAHRRGGPWSLAVLGRPQGQPVVAGARPARGCGRARDKPHARGPSRVRELPRRLRGPLRGVAAARRTAGRRRPQGRCHRAGRVDGDRRPPPRGRVARVREHRQGHRGVREVTAARADSARRLHRRGAARRRGSPWPVAGRRSPWPAPLHRQGAVRQLPQRPDVQRPAVPQHRRAAARCRPPRPRPRRRDGRRARRRVQLPGAVQRRPARAVPGAAFHGDRRPGAGRCVQDPRTARRGRPGTVHARRAVRHAGAGRAPLRGCAACRGGALGTDAPPCRRRTSATCRARADRAERRRDRRPRELSGHAERSAAIGCATTAASGGPPRAGPEGARGLR